MSRKAPRGGQSVHFLFQPAGMQFLRRACSLAVGFHWRFGP